MIRIFETPEALAQAAAERVAAAARRAIEARGRFRLGLSGGTTPRRLYEILAGPGYRDRVDWTRSEILFADERAVAPEHPDSNYRLVRETLLVPAGIPESRAHRMRGEAEDLDRAARDYEPLLAEPLDLLILGIGEDGHTASLFPGSPAAAEPTRRVLAVTSPKPPTRRLTVGPRVLAEAAEVLVLASGSGKAGAVARALEGPPDEVPAALARDRDWYLDRESASRRKG